MALGVLAVVSQSAYAFRFETSDDLGIRWDNTFKLNLMSRVARQDKDVYTPRAGAGWQLADDADLSVDRSDGGLVSTRLDLLTEFDLTWKEIIGFRISAAGWYDPQYRDSNNDHPGDRQLSWSNPGVGVALARDIAGVSVGADIVYRNNTGLAPEFRTSLTQTGVDFAAADPDSYPGAVGDTWHVNLSALHFLNNDWGMWDGGAAILEANFSMLDNCNRNCGLLTAAYNARFGPVLAGVGGLLKDRDNVSFTIKRTF